MVLENITNSTGIATQTVSLLGNWQLLVVAVILIIAAFVILYVMRNVIANSITGVAVLLIAKYIFGVAIEINGLTVLVTALGGLGGVAALFIAYFFGWL